MLDMVPVRHAVHVAGPLNGIVPDTVHPIARYVTRSQAAAVAPHPGVNTSASHGPPPNVRAPLNRPGGVGESALRVGRHVLRSRPWATMHACRRAASTSAAASRVASGLGGRTARQDGRTSGYGALQGPAGAIYESYTTCRGLHEKNRLTGDGWIRAIVQEPCWMTRQTQWVLSTGQDVATVPLVSGSSHSLSTGCLRMRRAGPGTVIYLVSPAGCYTNGQEIDDDGC
ncbi:hypothetical protein WOLCODRAFT_159568 [Wolfiporia cocos MD-104 SS10]|uniref:Uncharacterized protein n=1 Tax=Wolfiporia cocos (strain MD-104) TaxID=742152 RepID=A0A2H3J9R1_WOLCO|nr:hypothetical protein WOLCODRAFT_159568 [Wolfiporia cocos MD-104 SS10]